MYRIFYDLFLALYSLIARALSPFSVKAKKWVEGRKYIWDSLKRLPADKKRIWFHCASLGEYEQALPLIEKLQKDAEILLTFFSPSGYEIVKKKNPGALVFYLPHDSKSSAKRFLDAVQPALAVFVRYDLWYYYLCGLKERDIPSILISAVFGKNDIFFRWYGGLFRQMLGCFTHLFVQDEPSRKVLKENGVGSVTVAGNTRVDRVIAIREQARQFPVIERFKDSRRIFIFGSLEPNDEPVALPIANDAFMREHFNILIAPHLVSGEYILRLKTKISGKVALYSEAESQDNPESEVLIIDSIGMLSTLYRYADLAYIGGGFGEGLHNVLEPAVWGVPIFFGPRIHKFPEAVELAERKGAFKVRNAKDFKRRIQWMIADHSFLAASQNACSRYIREKQGGTEKIFRWLQERQSWKKV